VRDILDPIAKWWDSGETFGLATVVRTFRSAPREPGAALAVSHEGEVTGSVSGGCVEGAVYELAREVCETGRPVLQTYGVSDDDALAVGLTCGGILHIFVEPVDPVAFPELGDVAAAIAIPQMERLDAINASRRANAGVLSSLLAGNPSVTTPCVPAGRGHVWHQYTVLLSPGIDRDRVVALMSSCGVDAGVYYPALVWDHDAYRHHPNVHRDDTPVARDVASRCLSLPVHPGLSAHDLDRVAEALSAAIRAA